jgi:hypothetical protein
VLSSFSPPLLLTGHAQGGPGKSLQAFFRDGLPAIGTDPIGAILDACQRLLYFGEQRFLVIQKSLIHVRFLTIHSLFFRLYNAIAGLDCIFGGAGLPVNAAMCRWISACFSSSRLFMTVRSSAISLLPSSHSSYQRVRSFFHVSSYSGLQARYLRQIALICDVEELSESGRKLDTNVFDLTHGDGFSQHRDDDASVQLRLFQLDTLSLTHQLEKFVQCQFGTDSCSLGWRKCASSGGSCDARSCASPPDFTLSQRF